MPTFSLPKQPLPNKNSHCQNSHCQNSHCQNSHCQTTGQKLLSALCRFWTRNPCLSFFRWCLGRASSTTPPAWVRMVPPRTIMLYLFKCSLFQLTMCHQRRHQRECGWYLHARFCCTYSIVVCFNWQCAINDATSVSLMGCLICEQELPWKRRWKCIWCTKAWHICTCTVLANLHG